MPDTPIRLGRLRKGDIQQVYRLMAMTFAHVLKGADVDDIVGGYSRTHSRVLRRGDNIVGAYLIADKGRPILCESDAMQTIFHGKKGLQGLGLVLAPELLGQGYGRFLRGVLPEVARHAGAEFVWGVAAGGLNNSADWLKRRVPTFKNSRGLVSCEPLSAELKSALFNYATKENLDRWSARHWSAEDREVEARLILEETDTKAGLMPWFVTEDDVFTPPKLPSWLEAPMRELEGQTVNVTMRCGRFERGMQDRRFAVEIQPLNRVLAPGM